MGKFQDDLGVPCAILASDAATDDEGTRGRMRAAGSDAATDDEGPCGRMRAAFPQGRASVSANLEIVRSFIAAWRRNDLDEILSFFSDDCAKEEARSCELRSKPSVRPARRERSEQRKEFGAQQAERA
jgi:hypothetical protein